MCAGGMAWGGCRRHRRLSSLFPFFPFFAPARVVRMAMPLLLLAVVCAHHQASSVRAPRRLAAAACTKPSSNRQHKTTRPTQPANDDRPEEDKGGWRAGSSSRSHCFVTVAVGYALVDGARPPFFGSCSAHCLDGSGCQHRGGQTHRCEMRRRRRCVLGWLSKPGGWVCPGSCSETR